MDYSSNEKKTEANYTNPRPGSKRIYIKIVNVLTILM